MKCLLVLLVLSAAPVLGCTFQTPVRLVGGSQLGTYQVIVDRPGYREWIRNGVVVSHQNQCGGAEPVDLVARLQPAP